MDIYPILDASTLDLIVPYYLDESRPYLWDNQSWAAFPLRHGWDLRTELSKLNKGEALIINDKSALQAYSFTQAWLFFGMISFITGLPISTEAFLEVDEACGQRVTLIPLLNILELWASETNSWTESRRNQYVASIDPHLDTVGDVFDLCIGYKNTVPLNLSLSICLLFRILMLAKKRLFPNSMIPQERLDPNLHPKFEQMLVTCGWCRGVVNGIVHRLSTVHHMSLVGQARFVSQRDHASCTDRECKALVWKMRHIEGCHCANVYGPTISSILPMIEAGELPLIVLDEDSDLQLRSFPFADPFPMVPYFAISHLFGDGLGDPDENTMYKCQWRLLCRRAMCLKAQLSDLILPCQPLYIWIDTLCVPGIQGPTKNKAIATMKSVYERATAVLVIDRDFDRAMIRSRLEATLLIAASRWWTRLWTFQEGLFASRLFFFMNGQLLSFEAITKARDPDEASVGEGISNIKMLLVNDLIQSMDFASLKPSSAHYADGRWLLTTIGQRQATRREDEAVCLGILLDRDVVQIAAASTDADKRMLKFIELQTRFPSSTLFIWQPGDNLNSDGYRWAPRSFMSRKTLKPSISAMRHFNEVSTDGLRDASGQLVEDMGWADREGLHVRFPGFMLDVSNFKDAFYNRDKSIIRAYDVENKHGYLLSLLPFDGQQLRDWSSISVLGELAIVVPFVPNGIRRAGLGRLLLVRVAESEETSASILATVIIVYLNLWQRSPNVTEGSKKPFVTVTRLDEHHRWCCG